MTLRAAVSAKFAGPVAGLILIGGMGAGLPVHAFADGVASSDPTQQAAAPTDASTPLATPQMFTWSVQLADGSSEAGDSADIPDAITLAELGEPQADDAMIASIVTQEGQQVGASTVAAPVATPAPAPVAVPSSDDSGD